MTRVASGASRSDTARSDPSSPRRDSSTRFRIVGQPLRSRPTDQDHGGRAPRPRGGGNTRSPHPGRRGPSLGRSFLPSPSLGPAPGIPCVQEQQRRTPRPVLRTTRAPGAERRTGGTSVEVPAGDRSKSPVHRLVAGSAVRRPPAARGFARAGSRPSRKRARGGPSGPRLPRVPSRGRASCPAASLTMNVRAAQTGPPGQFTAERKPRIRLCTATARDHPRQPISSRSEPQTALVQKPDHLPPQPLGSRTTARPGPPPPSPWPVGVRGTIPFPEIASLPKRCHGTAAIVPP